MSNPESALYIDFWLMPSESETTEQIHLREAFHFHSAAFQRQRKSQ
jgi:hypothetical protein